MIGKISGLICVLSFVFGVINGNVGQMSEAIFEGASSAVTLTISLVGTLCLWNGIMQVATASGLIEKFSKIMAPLLKFLFPDAYRKKNGLGEIAVSISANIFGIGNAATPLAIKAMEKLQQNNVDKSVASDDMVMFTVLGTASLDLFPTTLIALRQTAGSENALAVVVPIWICSFITAVLGVILVKVFCMKKVL
ncbi:MAG: spore maturation protein [Clostridia bacterium]|nr:spore maturation protein [Clostridia bacterium]